MEEKTHWFFDDPSGHHFMLFGALITQAFGIERQVQVQEGKAESRMSLSKPLLQVILVDSGQGWISQIKRRIFPWTGREKLHAEFVAPFSLALLSTTQRQNAMKKLKERKTVLPRFMFLLQVLWHQ